MVSILHGIGNYWHYLIYEVQDDRSRGWFLCGSPLPLLLLAVVYQRFVIKIGPEFMKNRKPYNIDKIIQVYNVGQVIICVYISYMGFMYSYGPVGNYSWACEPIDKSMSPAAWKAATLTWIYYMVKISDLLDTIFFVLRKKFNQVSFLHVYHHIGMIILGYMATKYYPDGHGLVLLCVNSFVHSVMYSYYFISNYNPEYKKKIWWKKYITQLQICQFLFLMVHFGKVPLTPGCEYPLLPVFLFLPQNLLMTFLFLKFYKNSYLTPNKPLKSS